MSGTPALELRDLSAAAAPGSSAPVLQGVSLSVARGEQVAVIGASGAGKTSLLLAMACAVQPLAGALQLDGVDPWALSPAERQRLRGRLFLAPQTPPLPPRQRVASAVLAGQLPSLSLWRSLLRAWRSEDAPRAHAALEAFDLGGQLWQRVDRLSGGERQRVGLARALLSDATLWLIDEPLSALDPQRAAQAIASLQAHAREGGCTLVCTLHQVSVARERFERIVALQAGRIVYDGPSAGLNTELLTALYGGDAAALDTPADNTADALRLPQALCR